MIPLVAVAQSDLALSLDNITKLCTSAGSLIPSSALGGVSLAPGLYYATAYLTLGGVLTLDAAGDVNSVFAISSPQYLAVDPGAMMVSLVLGGEEMNPQCYWSLACPNPQILVGGATAANGARCVVSCVLCG